MKTNNRFFIKQTITFVILSSFLYSCVHVGFALENEEESLYDVAEVVLIPYMDTVKTMHKTAIVKFGFNGIYNEENIQQYESPDPRKKYLFSIIGHVTPTVKLNSFSYTDTKGNIIPSILYYKTRNGGVNIIDSFPIVFTNEMVKEKEIIGLSIFAECNQSQKSLKTVIVNYDIEVGSIHYLKSIKYEKKLVWEIRPKLF